MSESAPTSPAPSSAAPAPVAVALDGMVEGDALALARALAGRVWGFKIHDLLLRAGVEVIARLGHYGEVFCDLKLFDIPNTVAHQVRLLSEGGAALVTLHCAGGPAMLEAARAAREGTGRPTRLLGVTVLTSFDEAASRRLFGRELRQAVRDLATTALECGLDGVVCSPAELALLEELDPGRRLLRVTPGVRPAWYDAADDQRRTLTPAGALAGGAGLLVIGRPITAAPDPVAACTRILEELPPSSPPGSRMQEPDQ
jgi:orotidine-5'-phosphate decarboxylase